MMDKPSQTRLRFAVVIPCLNSPIIDQTVRSLLAQDCPEVAYSVIVVGRDDQNLLAGERRVTFVETDRPVSPAAARNIGVSRSTEEFLAFTDADCLADSHWLSSLADALSRDPDVIVGGGVAFDRGPFWQFVDNLATFHDVMAHLPAGERTQLPSLNLGMRRQDFEAAGGFDERLPQAAGEDSDLTFRLRRSGCRLVFWPEALVRHKPSRSSFVQLVQHAYLRGRYSLLVDPRFVGEIGLPRSLRAPWKVLLLSPVLATTATLRVYLANPKMWRYVWAMPLIYLTKLAWCFGARRRLIGPDPMTNQEPIRPAQASEGARYT